MPIKVLAARIGVTEDGLHKMMRNDTMQLTILFKIAEIFSIDPQVLLIRDFVKYQENAEGATQGPPVVTDLSRIVATGSPARRTEYLTQRVKQLKSEIEHKDRIIQEQERLLSQMDNESEVIIK